MEVKQASMIGKSDVQTSQKTRNEVNLSLAITNLPVKVNTMLRFSQVSAPNAPLENVSGSRHWWETMLRDCPAIVAEDSNLAQSHL